MLIDLIYKEFISWGFKGEIETNRVPYIKCHFGGIKQPHVYCHQDLITVYDYTSHAWLLVATFPLSSETALADLRNHLETYLYTTTKQPSGDI